MTDGGHNPAADFTANLSTGPHAVIQGDTGVLGFRTRLPTIYVKKHRGAEELDTWVHETVHASLPDMPEAEVARVAKDIAHVLWRAGYRRKLRRKP